MATRRQFMKSLASAAAAAGMAGAPQFSFAQDQNGKVKTFIKVFMRGGADGLHLFPLYGDTMNAYYTYRPDLAILPPSGNDGNRAINLGAIAQGMRGMNPNFAPLLPIWESGNMMIAPSTSFAGANRSHFDCQRWIGTGDQDNLIDGYLNRYMQEVAGPVSPLRGIVAGKTSISTEIRGRIRVPAIVRSGSYEVRNNDFCNSGCADNQLTDLMREIASHDVDLSAAEGLVKENQLILLDSIQDVTDAASRYAMQDDPGYTNSDLGRGLRLCAELIKGGVPLEVAALDWSIGWDTHSNQIDIDNTANPFSDQGKNYNLRVRQGATDFLRFWQDLGPLMEDVVVLVGSEFGRTKKQNGSVGTDHGEGGAWFAFGGPTNRKIARDVETIDDSVVDKNRLPTMTSYRDIVGEIMVQHMGMDENLIKTIFPGHEFVDNELFLPQMA